MRYRSERLTLFSQTRHGWLTGQIVSRQRQTVARGFQTRIATQVVTVIGVLVATGDLEYALPG